MEKCIIYVGLDVHKNSIEIALADWGRDNEVRHYGSVGGDLLLDKVVRKLVSQGRELHFVYEAGPCGYEIYRHLTRQGFDCIVVAPSLIPKKSGNRIKNDRRDAEMLARLHRAGELTPGKLGTLPTFYRFISRRLLSGFRRGQEPTEPLPLLSKAYPSFTRYTP